MTTKTTTSTQTTTEETPVVHCQICGRPIKLTKNGRIALHGYTRPYDGFQTASCSGARYQPYELSRDRIPVVIANCKTEITRLEALIIDLKANPPAENAETQGWKKRVITHTRPEGFVYRETDTWRYTSFNTYEYVLYRTIKMHETHIRALNDMISYLEKRYDAWIDPNPAPEPETKPEPAPVTETLPAPVPNLSVNLAEYNAHFDNSTYRLAKLAFSIGNELEAGNLLIDATFERLGASRYVGSYDRLIALFEADSQSIGHPDTKAEMRAQIDAHLANFPDLREPKPEPETLTDLEHKVLASLPTDEYDSAAPYIFNIGSWFPVAERLAERGYLKVTNESRYAKWYMLTEKGLLASNRALSIDFVRSLKKLAS